MDELNINQVDYKWVDDTEDARMLKKGLRLLKEDGGHFPHLENYIEDKLLKIDKKFK